MTVFDTPDPHEPPYTRTTCQQVEHVLAGRSVTGRAFSKPMSFSKGADARERLMRSAHFCLDRDGGPRFTIAQRTCLIRKLAVYHTRGGHGRYDLSLAKLWFSEHPETLTTRLSIVGAIRHFEISLLHFKDFTQGAAPRRVLSRDSYTLDELVGPEQLVAVGLEARNCLARSRNGHPVANPAYWDSVKGRHIKLFALRHRGRLCAVAELIPGILTYVEVIRYAPRINSIFDRCIGRLQSKHGFISTVDTLIMCPPRAPRVMRDPSLMFNPDPPPNNASGTPA